MYFIYLYYLVTIINISKKYISNVIRIKVKKVLGCNEQKIIRLILVIKTHSTKCIKETIEDNITNKHIIILDIIKDKHNKLFT